MRERKLRKNQGHVRNKVHYIIPFETRKLQINTAQEILKIHKIHIYTQYDYKTQ